jgi:hypothetical protein
MDPIMMFDPFKKQLYRILLQEEPTLQLRSYEINVSTFSTALGSFFPTTTAMHIGTHNPVDMKTKEK